jgi:phosphopantothenoylcysteine decarboxylase/phosphopantothenate--cysteine ligase
MIGPDAGDTACGEQGDGRLSDPSEIVAACLDQLNADQNMRAQDLAGQRAIVTSGPTCEPIDSVRFIANRSSGRQGHAIAAALAKRGADVTLISGPVSIADPAGVTSVHVETAAEMLDACEAAMPANIVVCAAAVADWRVKDPVFGKIKKNKERPHSPHLELIENPDILKHLSNHRTRPSLVIGFAAETSDLQKHGQAKLDSKGCDWIVANPVDAKDPANNVFGSNINEALLLTKDGCEIWPPMPKDHLAERLVDKISQTLGVENVED